MNIQLFPEHVSKIFKNHLENIVSQFRKRKGGIKKKNTSTFALIVKGLNISDILMVRIKYNQGRVI